MLVKFKGITRYGDVYINPDMVECLEVSLLNCDNTDVHLASGHIVEVLGQMDKVARILSEVKINE